MGASSQIFLYVRNCAYTPPITENTENKKNDLFLMKHNIVFLRIKHYLIYRC